MVATNFISTDDMSSPDTSLAWLWIIEYLASSKEIDLSILHDVVEMAPEFANDLGKPAREMVALRSLEEIFGTSNSVTNDIPSASVTKVEFDLAASCEDVLQYILQEASISDLKRGGPELLKWNVTPFIMHKRANMPKCALEQLKDAIFEGMHPAVASLREASGLACINECEKMHVDNGDHNGLSCRPYVIGSGSQTMAREGNSIPLGISEADSRKGNSFLSPLQNHSGGGASEEMMVQECPSIGEHERMQDQGFTVPDSEGETSEGENDKHIISSYSIRPRRQEKQYTFPPIPQCRRKKLPWTAKEEEMLKKGVQHFSNGDDKIIPWKQILEFGASVFLRGRTTIDLKDKWRNLCKGSPRLK